MGNRSLEILKRQKKLFGALVLFSIFVCFGVCYWVSEDSEDEGKKMLPKKVVSPVDRVNPQEIMIDRMESGNKLLEQRLKHLEEVLAQGLKKDEDNEQEKVNLKKELFRLQNQFNDIAEKRIPVQKEPVSVTRDPFQSMDKMSIPKIPRELKEYSMGNSVSKVSHVDKAIPAGTTVQAILLSSVDAICGVYSPSDPIPVKLRILDNGHLPKDVSVKLKGGVLIASAYGNISSERVFMRLERMTQTNPDGTFIETEVVGYVTGEDGKYGIRGIVVDKSEKIVTNAAYSGFLGGMSQILQSSIGNHSHTDNNYTLSVDMLKQGGYGGTASAFDMLADYYIRRAEQVQPVIQVNAGRIVDITFTHGTDLGDIHTVGKVQEVRQKNREAIR